MELAEEKAREGGGGELRDVQWVSTNDSLVGRLAQVRAGPRVRSGPEAGGGRPQAVSVNANPLLHANGGRKQLVLRG